MPSALRPPAVARCSPLPPPPPTAFTASAMISPALSPLSGSTAAATATPLPPGELMSTTAFIPGRSRSETARSRTSSRVSDSIRATSTPSTAASTRSPALAWATWRRSAAISAFCALFSSRRLRRPSAMSPTGTPRVAATSDSVRSSDRMSLMGSRPAMASRRRMFEPIDVSDTILSGPMSPSPRCTWVPPQNSIEFGPACSTRTVSPYLSPKNAMAPSFIASSFVISSCDTGALVRISRLARSSIATIWSGVRPSKWLKSNRRRSGPTHEPCCLTCVPSTLRSAQWRMWVAVWWRRMALRRSASIVAVTTVPGARPARPSASPAAMT